MCVRLFSCIISACMLYYCNSEVNMVRLRPVWQWHNDGVAAASRDPTVWEFLVINFNVCVCC